VSELANNGEAFDYVEAAGGLTEPKARQMMTQLVSAVDYIHKKGVAHRDLKLENCFLDSKAQLKVADFGLQKIFDGPAGSDLMTQCGTPNYMAPELIGEKKAYKGPPVDIFAMGVILFIMVFAKFPFGEAGDAYYQRMQSNPASYMKSRKI
jgi:serine/threonine protein kinase